MGGGGAEELQVNTANTQGKRKQKRATKIHRRVLGWGGTERRPRSADGARRQGGRVLPHDAAPSHPRLDAPVEASMQEGKGSGTCEPTRYSICHRKHRSKSTGNRSGFGLHIADLRPGTLVTSFALPCPSQRETVDRTVLHAAACFCTHTSWFRSFVGGHTPTGHSTGHRSKPRHAER